MTRPRLIAKKIALPNPPERYDPEVQRQTLREIENHLATLQPAQQRQIVTGAKGGNAALTSLLTALANLGFITDSTT